MFQHSTEKQKNQIVDSNCEVVFIKLYIQVYTQHTLSLLYTHTYTGSKKNASLCVCTCKHTPPEQKQSKVIKTCLSLRYHSFFLRSQGVRGKHPCAPYTPSCPPPCPVSAAAASVLFVCRLARCQVGGASTHHWAQGHGNPTACKTPQSRSVCAGVGVWV